MAGSSPPYAPGARRLLIVTADDFGLHPAVNAAVEQAADAGVLTAASLMMAAPKRRLRSAGYGDLRADARGNLSAEPFMIAPRETQPCI
jgi:hypothetical protein